jgi:hypothetical protein
LCLPVRRVSLYDGTGSGRSTTDVTCVGGDGDGDDDDDNDDDNNNNNVF